MTTTGQAYWEPLWAEGRHYRGLNAAEATALAAELGPGHGRLALDIGSGDGALAARLHELGYQVTGVDCAPSAIARARAAHPGLDYRHFDVVDGDLAELAAVPYAAITCRLVYRWIDDKEDFPARVRQLLAPDGVFWLATSVHDPTCADAKPWELSATDAHRLRTAWPRVAEHHIDPTFHCYALRL